MRPISQKIRKIIDSDPYYKKCARTDGRQNCRGRITMEHAWIYSGRQIDEVWAIIPLCVYHHLGDGMHKRMNELISLRRASWNDLKEYPRKNWLQELDSLEARFGKIIEI